MASELVPLNVCVGVQKLWWRSCVTHHVEGWLGAALGLAAWTVTKGKEDVTSPICCRSSTPLVKKCQASGNGGSYKRLPGASRR